jgi:hypothetical protein
MVASPYVPGATELAAAPAAALLLVAVPGEAVPPQAARAPRLRAPRPLAARKLRRVDFEANEDTEPPGKNVIRQSAPLVGAPAHRLKASWRSGVDGVTARFLRSPSRGIRTPRKPLRRAARALE